MDDAINPNERLLQDFPPVATESWEEVIHTDLKGADYDRKLVWRTLEGFNLQPYYRRADLAKLPNVDVQPGQYPYIRGYHAEANPWLVRQDLDAANVAKANALAVDFLRRGANAIAFVLPVHSDPTVGDIKALLKGIDPHEAEVVFTNPGRADLLLPTLERAFKELAGGWEAPKGAVEFSQLAWLCKTGRLCQNHGTPTERALRALEFHQRFPGMQSLMVDGRLFHNAGANIVQELAYTLAEAVQYIDWLTEAGVDLGQVASTIRFNFAVGTTYFMEMAKFRAVKYLWAKILDAYGLKDRSKMAMQIHVETSRFYETVYDPYINLLRHATEGMSAVLAGIHSLTISPFDTAFSEPAEFSWRIARNAQLLMREESHFDRVIDPAGGSYYVETITQQLIAHTWQLFCQVQQDGGFLASFTEGKIQKAIQELAATRMKRYATRRDTLLGTNQFPNFIERAKPEVMAAVEEREGIGCGGCAHATAPICEPLQPLRGAQQFEHLRFATDRLDDQPLAFMLAIGNLAMRRARAQFSCNFLACAGFKVVDNIGFDSLEQGLAEARKQQAKIIVLCSSDDEYADLGKAALPLMQSGEILVVAGAPACQPDLEKAGIKYFINVKSNLLETLQEFQKDLGIC